MIRRILPLICGVFFVYATYLSGIRFAEHIDPDFASVVGGLDPDRSLRENKRALRAAAESSELNAAALSVGSIIAIEDPLSDLPYILPLIDASTRQDTARMAELSNHVLRLNPRNRVGRFVDAQLSVQSGDAEPAMAALANLLTLNPTQTDTYLAEVSQLARTQAGRTAILTALEKEPAWTGPLVQRLTEDLHDTDFLLQLFEFYPNGQNSYIAALAKRGELERAHLTFLNYLPAELIGKTGVPYDSKFMGLPGAAPFNWQFHREYASLEPQGGLYISFFGQGQPTIAQQTLRLSPGTYIGEMEINGRVHRAGGHLSWTLMCARSGEELFAIDIQELMSSSSVLEAGFEVPERACAFQTLRLQGVAGEFPRTTRALVTRMQIAPL